VELGSWSWNEHRLTYEAARRGPARARVHPRAAALGRLQPAARSRLAARGHRVVVPELLGHGRSDAPRHATEYRLEYLAEQVLALLDTSGRRGGGRRRLAGRQRHAAARGHAPGRLRAAILEMPVLERGGSPRSPVHPAGVSCCGFPGPSRLVMGAVRRLPAARGTPPTPSSTRRPVTPGPRRPCSTGCRPDRSPRPGRAPSHHGPDPDHRPPARPAAPARRRDRAARGAALVAVPAGELDVRGADPSRPGRRRARRRSSTRCGVPAMPATREA
jgi:pimeloyl-ACP methyl ester carboxylesterase